MANALTGGKELSIKLGKIGAIAGEKVLRSAVRQATKRTVAQMRAAAPRGKTFKRTYKGNIAGPGFLSRSIVVATSKDRTRGSVSVAIGLKNEAYYGWFLDLGPMRITQRRLSTGRRTVRRSHTRRTKNGKTRVVEKHEVRAHGRRSMRIKPYTLRRHPFLSSVFDRNREGMERELIVQLTKKLR